MEPSMSREVEFSIASPDLGRVLALLELREREHRRGDIPALTPSSTSSAQPTTSACISSRVRPSWSSGSVVIAIDTRKGPSLVSGSSWSLGIEPLMAAERSTDYSKEPWTRYLPLSICISADLVCSRSSSSGMRALFPTAPGRCSPPSSLGNQSPTLSKSQLSSSSGATWLGEGTIRMEDCSSDFAEV